MVPKIFIGIIVVCVLQMYLVNCHSDNTVTIRHKRTLYFPHHSSTGLAILLAMPLNDWPPGRSVFFAYNFEAKFFNPYFDKAFGLVPSPFTWISEPPASRTLNDAHEDTDEKLVKGFVDEKLINETIDVKSVEGQLQLLQPLNDTMKHQHKTDTVNREKKKPSKKTTKIKVETSTKKSRKNRSPLQNYFMSRRRFYKLMESKLDSSGLQGNDCLLKAICETAQSAFGSNNGVIGSVIDVLFLPSASRDEKLPKRYYQAENNGKAGMCDVYNKKCPKGIFDFISKII